MKKITKKTVKEYDEQGKLIKHLETVIEKVIENDIPWTPIQINPNPINQPIVCMYAVNPVPLNYYTTTYSQDTIK